MASRHKTFLIKATSGREAVMRLPIDRYGGFTTKAHKLIQQRFYEGSTDTHHGVQYALCLEAFTTGDSLAAALHKYRANEI